VGAVPIATTGRGRPAGRTVEYEFEQVTFPRHVSRNVVAKLLTEQAEHSGWELAKVRIRPDGTRRVVLRRKIIRQARTA
jgi:hypothetical protein